MRQACIIWSIKGIGIYVGEAKRLRTRLNAYPRNVRAMLNGRFWHGNPQKDYRAIHHALRAAYEEGTPVIVTVLEICDPAIRYEREQCWIQLRRREEAEDCGPHVLNSN